MAPWARVGKPMLGLTTGLIDSELLLKFNPQLFFLVSFYLFIFNVYLVFNFINCISVGTSPPVSLTHSLSMGQKYGEIAPR